MEVRKIANPVMLMNERASMVNIISDMGKRLFPAEPKQKIPSGQDGSILCMYARDFLVWSCLEVL